MQHLTDIQPEVEKEASQKTAGRLDASERETPQAKSHYVLGSQDCVNALMEGLGWGRGASRNIRWNPTGTLKAELEVAHLRS